MLVQKVRTDPFHFQPTFRIWGIHPAPVPRVLRLALISLLTVTASLRADIEGGKRCDVLYWQSTNLQQFGGPNVEIVICGRNMGVVDFAVINNEHEVASAQTNINAVNVDFFGNATVSGTNHVVFHPVTIRKSVRLEHGIEVAGTHAEAYLLHEIPDGPKVYLLDAMDTNMNGCALLIVGKSKAEKNSEPIEERLRKVEKLEKAGVISEAEARQKRQEILANL